MGVFQKKLNKRNVGGGAWGDITGDIANQTDLNDSLNTLDSKMSVKVDKVFVSTWDTRNTSAGSSSSNQITLPLKSSGIYDFVVDWGDGTKSEITAYDDSEVTHTYQQEGIYELRITGVINGFGFSNSGDKEKITEISEFGVLNIKDSGSFWGCSNMELSATDVLNAVSGSNLAYLFRGCDSIINAPRINAPDVTNLYYTFAECDNLVTVPSYDFSNANSAKEMFKNSTSLETVGHINISNVTDAEGMFEGCSSLTSVGSLKTDSLTKTFNMFEGCSSLVTAPNFDTSLVTYPKRMFYGCSSLTTVPLYDLSLCGDVEEMFRGCTSLTTIPMFDLSSAYDAKNMFLSVTLTTANYSAFLEHLDTLTLQDNVNFNAGNSMYNTDGGTARANIISNYSWSISDGGAE